MKSSMDDKYSPLCSNCCGQNLLISNNNSQIFSTTNSGMYFRDGGIHSFKGNKTSLNLVNLGESVFKQRDKIIIQSGNTGFLIIGLSF